jgi:hypothetical protein
MSLTGAIIWPEIAKRHVNPFGFTGNAIFFGGIAARTCKSMVHRRVPPQMFPVSSLRLNTILSLATEISSGASATFIIDKWL